MRYQSVGWKVQVDLQLAMAVVVNVVAIVIAFSRLSTRVAVVQARLHYIEKKLYQNGTLPMPLERDL